MITTPIVPSAEQAVAEFIKRWEGSAAAERANFQSFCNELCDMLGVPRPDPSRQDERDNAYVYDKAVQFDNGDGNQTSNWIDLYRRGCFVMEAKQGSTAMRSRGSTCSMSALTPCRR